MKYFSLTLFFFLIHISLATVNALGLIATPLQPQNDWFTTIDQDGLLNESYIQGEVNAGSEFDFGDFIKGFFYFITTLGLGIISVPYTLGLFGLKAPFIYYFSLPVYLLYLVGIAQFISNRGLKGMS